MSLETVRLGLPFIAAGQAQKEITHNEALALLDMGVSASAESVGADTPPATPALGQCWIVGNAPSGVWSDHAGALACWTEGGWRFLPSLEGLSVWIKDQQLWAIREASGWAVGSVRAARVTIEGEQIIGRREPAVSAPSGGSIVDIEARAAIVSLIARLVAHGLIA